MNADLALDDASPVPDSLDEGADVVRSSLLQLKSPLAFGQAVHHLHTQGESVVAPPSSVVKCLWKVFVWGFRVLFLSCACVSVSGVLFSVGVYVCVTC